MREPLACQHRGALWSADAERIDVQDLKFHDHTRQGRRGSKTVLPRRVSVRGWVSQRHNWRRWARVRDSRHSVDWDAGGKAER